MSLSQVNDTASTFDLETEPLDRGSLETEPMLEADDYRSDKCLRKLGPSESWCPKMLQKKYLGGFIFGFVTIILIITILFCYSNAHNGLATANQDLHYVWTYGPTAGE